MDNIDPQRDEILLARNDRYWSVPATPDLLLFRRAGATAALADSIRNGDTQVAQVHGGAAAFAQLSAIPDVRTARIVTPRVMQLTLRAQLPKLADSQVRKAILGLLDVDLLASVGAGDDNTVTLAQAQVRTPSDPGYVPTAPRALTTEAALGLLAGVGYQVEPVDTATPTPGTPLPENSRGRISKDGVPLTLVLGVAANDPDVGRRRQHRGRPVAQCRHRGVGAGAGSGGALRRGAHQQPGGRGRRLASGRR